MTTSRSLTRTLLATGLLILLSVPARGQSPDTIRRAGSWCFPPQHHCIGSLTRALYTPDSTIEKYADLLQQSGNRVSPIRTDEAGQGSVVGSVLGATLGMVSGIGSGLLIDTVLSDDDTSGGCVIVLEIVGVGVGAHLGNGRHGRVGLDIGASFASLLLGTLTVSLLAGDRHISPVLPCAVLGLQIASAVVVERSSARRKRRLTVPNLSPIPDVSPTVPDR